MDLRPVFAANLRRLRREKGLTQEDLAFAARVDRAYLSILEKSRGKTYVGLEVIGKLAEGLGVEAMELLRPLPKRSARGS